LALAVPLSRFTSRVGGGSAFFVRHRGHGLIYALLFSRFQRFGQPVSAELEFEQALPHLLDLAFTDEFVAPKKEQTVLGFIPDFFDVLRCFHFS